MISRLMRAPDIRTKADKDKYKFNAQQADRRWLAYHSVVGEPSIEQLVDY